MTPNMYDFVRFSQIRKYAREPSGTLFKTVSCVFFCIFVPLAVILMAPIPCKYTDAQIAAHT